MLNDGYVNHGVFLQRLQTRSRATLSLLPFVLCMMALSPSLLAHDPHDPIVTVAASPNYAQDQTVFAAMDYLSLKIGTYALLKSSNGGVNWSAVAGLPNNTRITSIAFSPAYSQDKTIYVAGAGGLARSMDQGTTWTISLKQALQMAALSPNFATDNTLFVVTTAKTLLTSSDRGQTWKSLAAPTGLTAGLGALAVSSNYAADHTLLLGTQANGIFKSSTSGSSWQLVTSGLVVSAVNGLAFSPIFSSDRTAFAATGGTGVLVSRDGANTWTSSNAGITDLNATSLALSPSYTPDSTLWITTASGGVFQSTTSAASWTPGALVSRTLSNQTSIHYQAIAAAGTSVGPVLYLAMFEGLWTSSSGGSSWLYIDTLPTRLVRYIHLSPNFGQDKTVFASTYGGGNLWSVNGGTSWSFQNTGMNYPYTDASGISPNYAADGTAFGSNDSGLVRTINRGSSWITMSGPGFSTYPRALAVSPAFAQDATVLVGLTGSGSNAGLYRSKDGGNTWLSTSLTGITGIISIAISPAFATDKTALAASPTNGAYKSTDGGQTWTTVSGLPTAQMAIVVFSPGFATDRTIFAAGIAGGIFKSTDGGLTWSTLAQTSSLRALNLVLSPNYATDQTFFAGTLQKGLVKFTKGGTTLSQVTTFPDCFVTAVGISPGFASDHTLFAAGYHGLFKSTDGGTTWTNTAAPARIEETQSSGGSLEQPPIISYQGNWLEVTSSMASSNGYMQSGAAQSAAVLTFTGSGVDWIASTGPQQGSAAIQLDGVSQGNLSLSAATTLYQQLVWQVTGLACGRHTLTITAQSASPGSIDAFDVWFTNCPSK